jgi:hypothetical protein
MKDFFFIGATNSDQTGDTVKNVYPTPENYDLF